MKSAIVADIWIDKLASLSTPIQHLFNTYYTHIRLQETLGNLTGLRLSMVDRYLASVDGNRPKVSALC